MLFANEKYHEASGWLQGDRDIILFHFMWFKLH